MFSEIQLWVGLLLIGAVLSVASVFAGVLLGRLLEKFLERLRKTKLD